VERISTKATKHRYCWLPVNIIMKNSISTVAYSCRTCRASSVEGNGWRSVCLEVYVECVLGSTVETNATRHRGRYYFSSSVVLLFCYSYDMIIIAPSLMAANSCLPGDSHAVCAAHGYLSMQYITFHHAL
jgi:hypothetical protein